MTWSTSVLCIGPSVNPTFIPFGPFKILICARVRAYRVCVAVRLKILSAQIGSAKLWTVLGLILNRNGYFSLSKR